MMIFFFSSGVLDASERDSNRKTRWNSAINQQDRTSASSSSECSPNSTLRKGKKSRNEGTVLLRFAGDINILVTPLVLEALQRCVTKQCELRRSFYSLFHSNLRTLYVPVSRQLLFPLLYAEKGRRLFPLEASAKCLNYGYRSPWPRYILVK